MLATRFRATLNGFRVVSETWDDLTNSDGQHDEIYFKWAGKKLKSDGAIVYGGNSHADASPKKVHTVVRTSRGP